MPLSPLVVIPEKTTEPTDWSGPLRSFIAGTYGDAKGYNEECQAVNSMRDAMRGAGEDMQGREMIYRYYGQLELIGLHFPVAEDEGVRIAFTWNDAFSHRPVTQHSLAFEKASVLFNLAAVSSSIAASATREDAPSTRLAFSMLQSAAGILDYINDSFLHAPSTDMSKDTVRALSVLMLAQAQEVFTERSIADSKKSAMVSRLAAQTSALYSQAAEKLTDLITVAIIDRAIVQAITAKSKLFMSIALFHQAKVDVDEMQYGKALGRLDEAKKLAKESKFATIQEMVDLHTASLNELHKSVAKDNEFIYHQSVPSEVSPVAKMLAAKATPLHDCFSAQDVQRIIGGDLFQKLVPLAVLESASIYSEEKAKLIRQETERITEADANLESTLQYYSLPESLNQFRSGTDDSSTDNSLLTSQMRQWSTQIRPIEPRLAQLSSELAPRIMASLSKASDELDQEERECQGMRRSMGPAWTQRPSNEAAFALRDRIRSLRSGLDKALRTDTKIRELYDTHKSDLEALRSQKPLFSSRQENLLDVDENAHTQVAIQADEIEEICRKLELIKRERQQTLKDMRAKVGDDDISQVLVLSRKNMSSDSNIIRVELEKYNPFRLRISATIRHQETLLDEIRESFKSLLANPQVQERKRQFSERKNAELEAQTRFQNAWTAYQDIDQGLTQGTEFYRDALQQSKAVESDVALYISRRRDEGAAIIDRIQGGGGVSSAMGNLGLH